MECIFFKKVCFEYFDICLWDGVSSLGGLFVVGGVHRASSVFGGICSITGEWSELRLWSLFVVDVYRALLGVLM